MLILASQSPRRKEILTQLGIQFECQPSLVDESKYTQPDPIQNLPQILADAKAKEVSLLRPESFVIGSDTVVFVEDRALGKPENLKEAEKMLQALSGQHHQVISSVSLFKNGHNLFQHSEVTQVKFRILSQSEILDYIQNEEVLDKAGSYGIQEKGARFVESIQGCYFNVMGLPVQAIVQIEKEFLR
jgi:septum formation protein